MKQAHSTALYGGSFDPPHIGHEAVMKAALAQLPIEELIVMPARLSPFKNAHAAPPQKRLAWLKAMTAFDKRITVSDMELTRPGPSYTLETVRALKPRYETLYLIVGADNLAGLRAWHGFEALDKLVTWVVADRDGIAVPEGFIRLNVSVPVSSTSLRNRLDPRAIPAVIRESVLKYYLKSEGAGLSTTIDSRIERIIRLLDEKKAEDIQVFDLHDKEYLAQYVVIATTLGDKHTLALLDYLKEKLKPEGEHFFAVEEGEQWTVIDLGEIMVHLMVPEYRARYNLEEFLESLGKKEA